MRVLVGSRTLPSRDILQRRHKADLKKIMIPFTAVLWIAFLSTANTEFACPDLTPTCTCGQQTDWFEDVWAELTYVNCSSRRLTKIPDFTSLQGRWFDRLLLSENRITEIRGDDFRNLSVREIILRNNPLKRISNDAFVALQESLQSLDMGGDKIKIDEGLPFLHGLYKLESLDLGKNVLKDKYGVFPAGLFSNLNLSSLRTLTLQALKMSGLAVGTFAGIERLEQLDLSYNYLPEFPKELLKLKHLKGIKLYTNEIMVLKNNSFKGLTNLKKLLLGVNDIGAIEQDAFRDLEDSIEEINLFHNPLSRVPTEAIASLRYLKKLSVVKTNLNNRSIENGSFVGEYKLSELHLDDNPELSFNDEGMFQGIEDSLEILYLRTLNLSQLPTHILRRLKNLYYLDVTDNRIRKIDKHFFKGLKLYTVKLMWNHIRHVDHRAFKKFPKGVVLHLRENNIQDISFILKVKACTFKEVDVTRNKIKCDCTLENVLNSGLVSWGVLGECYVSDDDKVRWYSFSDPSLHEYLGSVCNTTRPYASCMQSVSRASLMHDNQWTIYTCSVGVIFVTILSYLSRKSNVLHI